MFLDKLNNRLSDEEFFSNISNDLYKNLEVVDKFNQKSKSNYKEMAMEWLKEDCFVQDELSTQISYKEGCIRALTKEKELLYTKKFISSLKGKIRSLKYCLKKISEESNDNSLKWEEDYNYSVQADVFSVIQMYQPDIKPNTKVKCPFHGKDNNPSMSIYRKSNKFYCFTCCTGGSAIDYVMKMENCDFKEAVSIIV